MLALKPDALALASASMHLPAAAVVAAQSVGGGVLCFLRAWAGLKFGAPKCAVARRMAVRATAALDVELVAH